MRPPIHGKDESFPNNAQEVEMWATNLDPAMEASAPILNMGPFVRDICMAAEIDQFTHQDGAMGIT